MREPNVSIFWLNYNSSSFIDIALESLKGVMDLNYTNYELIVVDNCSTDGSFSIIEDFVKKKMGSLAKKIIRLNRNVGFNGGNNAAYRSRNRESKYIAFLNNDAIPYPNSLEILAEVMEGDNSLGALEGILLKYDGRTVESAGNFISEFLTIHSLCTSLKKSHYITFADGTFSIQRVSSIRKAVGCDDTIFDENMFAYYDDSVLGLKMWNTASKVAMFPVTTARHKGSSSFGRIKPFQAYLEARGLITLNEISNCRYKEFNRLLLIYNAHVHSVLENNILGSNFGQTTHALSTAIFKGVEDGLRIGRLKRNHGETVDFYKAPIAKLSLPVMVSLFPGMRLSGNLVKKLNQYIVDDIKKKS